MTDPELIEWFAGRDFPKGWVKFSSFEYADDLAHMVALAIERIQANGSGAATSRSVLMRVKTYLEGQE